MLGANTVMDTVEPGFQVREDEVDHRHELLGYLGIAAFGDGVMVVAPFAEAGIAAPVVSDGQRSRHDSALDEPTQRASAAVSHDSKPDAPGVAAILSLVLRGAGF